MKFGTVRVQLNSARSILSAILGCTLPFVSQAQERGQEFRFHSAGTRIGFPAEKESERFQQAEAFLDYNLWRWKLSESWSLQSRLGASVGCLGGRGDDAFIGSVGPSLEISRVGIPLSIDCGVSPTYTSRYRFGRIDLGTDAQFTSHIGCSWDVTSRWRIGYRFQHMSNGGIKEPNPGFNLHILSFGYLF